MNKDLVRIRSISELHEILGIAKPQHPLISLIDAEEIHIPEDHIGNKVIYDFYMVSMKDNSCGVDYGRHSFDFSEGVLVFSGPGQTFTINESVEKGDIKGWVLYFHPDLIRNTYLANEMHQYNFFQYEVFEALHLSAEEEQTINDCIKQIEHEYSQRIDNHSQRVIVSNLALLLNYSLRFYERQFNTRSGINSDIVSRFTSEIDSYFRDEKQLLDGQPAVGYFANKVNLSSHYFSDLIKKETGRAPKDHINEYIVEKAKDLLSGSERSVSEIAYQLGFNYPHYFTRMFKSRTGLSPVDYRQLN